VIALLEITLPVRSSVKVPTGTVAIVQSPVLESYVPALGLLETKLNPAGSLSLTITFCAALGPALVKLILYIAFSLRFGVGLLNTLLKLKSALAVSNVLVVLELLVFTGSTVLEVTLAVFTVLAVMYPEGTLYVEVITRVSPAGIVVKLQG
jgi:hypothetical protein